MNRRDVIVNSLGAISAAALAGGAGIFEAKAFAGPNGSKISEAAAKCVSVGLACMAHCRKELSTGNKAMAECMASVTDVLASCEALQKLAANESPHLKAMALACAEICKDCAKKCEPHSKHMDVCRQCMEACKDCAAACEAA